MSQTPFNLECAKAGDPVCTRDGRKARYIGEIKGPDGLRYIFGIQCAAHEYMKIVNKEGWVGVFKRSNCVYDDDLFMVTPDIPKGYIRYDGWPCPVDFGNIERVMCRNGGNILYPAHGIIIGNWKHSNHPYDIIAYKLKPSLNEVIFNLTEEIQSNGLDINELLHQFADAIKNEIKDNK